MLAFNFNLIDYYRNNNPFLNFFLMSNDMSYLLYNTNIHKVEYLCDTIEGLTGYKSDELMHFINCNQISGIIDEKLLKNCYKKIIRFSLSKKICELFKFKFSFKIDIINSKNEPTTLMLNISFLNDGQDCFPKKWFVVIQNIPMLDIKPKEIFTISAFDNVEKKYKTVYIEVERNSHKIILYNKEYELLRLISNGHSSKEIARFLSLSLNTVENYRKQLQKRFKVNNTYQLLSQCKQVGII